MDVRLLIVTSMLSIKSKGKKYNKYINSLTSVQGEQLLRIEDTNKQQIKQIEHRINNLNRMNMYRSLCSVHLSGF